MQAVRKYLDNLASYFPPTFIREAPYHDAINEKTESPVDFDDTSTSFFGEFGYELISVLPFAYWLHLHGRLQKTESVKDTSCFYFFSPNHRELERQRTFQIPETPNCDVHAAQVNTRQWCPPPLRDFYFDNRLRFQKPLLIIHNKFTIEWDSSPINYFTLSDLEGLFNMFSPSHTVVYIRPTKECIVEDHQSILELGDLELLTKFPAVIPIQKLAEEYRHLTFNHLQLLLHAGCKKFISVQGGCSVLASYFGGTNLILAKKGRELIYQSFEHFYHLLSGCRVRSFGESKQLLKVARELLL